METPNTTKPMPPVPNYVDECPVCMSELALYRLPCRHVFCCACIRRLLWDGRARQTASCPLCRSAFWWPCDAHDCNNLARVTCEIPADARMPLRVYRRLLRRGVDMHATFSVDPPLLDRVLASCRARPWVLTAMNLLARRHTNLAADVRLSSAASQIAATEQDQRVRKFVVFRRLLSYRRNPPSWDLVRPLAETLGMVAHCQTALDMCGQGIRRLAMLDPLRTTVTLTDGHTLNLIQYWALLNVPGVADGRLPSDPKEIADLLTDAAGDALVSPTEESIVRALITTAAAYAGACSERRVYRLFGRPTRGVIAQSRMVKQASKPPPQSPTSPDYGLLRVDRARTIVWKAIKHESTDRFVTRTELLRRIDRMDLIPTPCAACEPLIVDNRCSMCQPVTRHEIVQGIKHCCDTGLMLESQDAALGTVYARLN